MRHRAAYRDAHAEFLYGEDRVTPSRPASGGPLRDARAESRAKRLLATYLEPGAGGEPGMYGIGHEEEHLTACWRRACPPCWPRVKYT